MADKLITELEKRLNAKSIHDLRQVGRALGIFRPADGKKDRLISDILKLALAEADPVKPSTKGAPPKSSEYDRQLVSDVLRCREISLAQKAPPEPTAHMGEFRSNPLGKDFEFKSDGILEYTDGKWFLRTKGCREDLSADVFVNDYYVLSHGLREGDLVSGRCRRDAIDEMAGLAEIYSVNGVQPAALKSRRAFEKLTPVYANRRLTISNGRSDRAGRLIDLLAPIGAGQRGLIVSPRGCGKRLVLKDIALGVKSNDKNLKLVIVLLDASPEDSVDFIRSFPDANVFVSPLDAGMHTHVRVMHLALEYCKRQVEFCNNVVLFVDNFTSLALAYNSCIKQPTVAIDYGAIDAVKRMLASARNIEEGGSLTIIGTLDEGGSDTVEGVIYRSLRDVCNLKITLSLASARLRMYPPLNLEETYSAVDSKLLSPEELSASLSMRYKDLSELIRLVVTTENNEKLIEQIN